MLLIADSGGTSTKWALIGNDNISYFDGQGLHPDIIDSKTQLPEEIESIKEKVDRVIFYGTGCANETKAYKVKEFLKFYFPVQTIDVYSDLLALAHPVFENREGLVAILGTGSSMAYYDGKELHFEIASPGKGIDPGSGPVIGKITYQKYRNQKLGQDTMSLFESELMNSKINDYVLSHINTILFKNLNNSECFGIIKDAFLDYFEYYRPLWSMYYYPIVFGGSIAALGEPILANVMKRKGIQLDSVVRYPIEILVDYYKQLEQG